MEEFHPDPERMIQATNLYTEELKWAQAWEEISVGHKLQALAHMIQFISQEEA